MRAFVLALAIGIIVSTASSAQDSHADHPLIDTGSGSFHVAGGENREDKTIGVYYHKPATFTAKSRVLLVLPGAGRNGGTYRDDWIEASEEHGVLILALEYPEDSYPNFWSYNLAGMISEVEINEARTAMVGYTVNRNPTTWIFADFDRIFAEVKDELGLEADTYDMFGHSAGGQILHRMVLFHPENNANRILASNSGWYTVPTFDGEFPFGLDNLMTTGEGLGRPFMADLVVFLGELDDENETRGHLVRSPEVDVQGISRIERGKHFYTTAKQAAEMLDSEFNWKIKVIPNVGHDHKRMSDAAADYLY